MAAHLPSPGVMRIGEVGLAKIDQRAAAEKVSRSVMIRYLLDRGAANAPTLPAEATRSAAKGGPRVRVAYRITPELAAVLEARATRENVSVAHLSRYLVGWAVAKATPMTRAQKERYSA